MMLCVKDAGKYTFSTCRMNDGETCIREEEEEEFCSVALVDESNGETDPKAAEAFKPSEELSEDSVIPEPSSREEAFDAKEIGWNAEWCRRNGRKAPTAEAGVRQSGEIREKKGKTPSTDTKGGNWRVVVIGKRTDVSVWSSCLAGCSESILSPMALSGLSCRVSWSPVCSLEFKVGLSFSFSLSLSSFTSSPSFSSSPSSFLLSSNCPGDNGRMNEPASDVTTVGERTVDWMLSFDGRRQVAVRAVSGEKVERGEMSVGVDSTRVVVVEDVEVEVMT